MSTRCNVTLYDRCESGWREGPILYHHSDGYPEAMVPKLEGLLRRAMTTLRKSGFGVDSEKVAALIVVDSVRPDEVPSFCPCRRTHDDIDYKYEVYIDEERPTIEATDRHGHTLGSVAVEVGGGT
jgi:hypothetical protein